MTGSELAYHFDSDPQTLNPVARPLSQGYGDAVFSASRDGIVIVDASGVIVALNPMASWLLDVAGCGNIGSRLFDCVEIASAPELRSGSIEPTEKHVVGMIPSHEGRPLPVEVCITELDDTPGYFAVQLRDISQHSEFESELKRIAFHDSVTQLPNRHATLLQLKEMLNNDAAFTVWHMNIDRFRILKNSLGHGFGERVLFSIGEQLRNLLGPDAWIGRLGGDEFVMILYMISADEIAALSDQIQLALARNLHIDGRHIHLKASIGVVEREPVYSDASHMLADAEIASFQAKIAGGGSHALFDQPMREVLMEMQRTESDLRAAVQADNQLWVAFQPIVELSTRKLAGFEALVRWDHPELGTIPPAEFIPIAEATGLIVPLGADVFSQACIQAKRWLEITGPENVPFISVNLSLRQLAEPDFIESARVMLADTGIDPRKVKLEITESMLMTNPEESIARLRELRELGLELSIDDFGTGYSSLAYLHRLPVSTLKIDKSFVSSLDKPGDREIVRIITQLANILGLSVIAEGIEDVRDVPVLMGLGCNYAQGFCFSKPLDEDEAAALVKDPSGLARV